MQREACVIKGNRYGLLLSVAENASFADVLVQLRAKLSSHKDFFQGAVVSLHRDSALLTEQEKEKIRGVISEYGMTFSAQAPPEPPEVRTQAAADVGIRGEEDTKLVRRTLRSGQSIHYAGNVIVMGDVNPGSEVVCSGDILVLGALRGVAHAGAEGNTKAVVFAFRLEPTQLRIAHYISRAPDEKGPRPTGPELAQVIDNLIQIRLYEKS